jgi:arylsulfatase A-like enzyme
MLISGPGVDTGAPDVEIATSHVDLIPTLLGLVGADVEAAAAAVARHHVETQPFVGRDLSALLAGSSTDDALDAPVYFMTEDEISRGLRQTNLFSGDPFEPVGDPGKVETVLTRLPTGEGDTVELWKLNHYYERLDGTSEVDDEWELHNLTVDPEERTNRASDAEASDVLAQLRAVLDDTRATMRRTPQHVNPPG